MPNVKFVSLQDIDRARVSSDEGDCLVVTDQRDQKQGQQSEADKQSAREAMIQCAGETGKTGWLAYEVGPEYHERYGAWIFKIRAVRYKHA